MERYPLIDEFAVIDSGSQDKTLEVACNYGADTYLASDILPEVGDKRGKGENLWKAIHQLKGILFAMWMRTSPTFIPVLSMVWLPPLSSGMT